MEARGFILAAPVALALGAGFVPVRKAGKLPRATLRECLRARVRRGHPGDAPDALAPGDGCCSSTTCSATGGTVAATRALVEHGGARARVAVLMELGFLPGRESDRRPALTSAERR
jgi:adenine phosphoribosyltransferase